MKISVCLRFLILSASGIHAATLTSATWQPINGIGASGAWWPNDLYHFPAEVQANVSQLLFNQTTGLGLTDYRYNLGGGGIGVGTADRTPETPYISDGVYNFSADPQGTFFLREAARQGVPIITLFVNSAPTTMTTSGQNCGGTLITDRIPAYAQYLADVVSYWKTQGVNISYVSPMNEPDDNFDDGDPSTLCGQEGMIVMPDQRAQVVTAVSEAFANASLSTVVIADESSDMSNFDNDSPTWLSPDVGNILGGIAHHQYGFDDEETQQAMGQLARSLSGGRLTWFTEICCYIPADDADAEDPLAALTYGGQYDPTMVSALRMANLVYESFVDIGDAHWDWWTALSNGLGDCTPNNSTCASSVVSSGWDDGLLYYDPNYASTGFYELIPTKRYSVLRHFTKAAPVGAVRRNVTDLETGWRVLAFDAAGSCESFSTCAQTPFSLVAMNAQQSASLLVLTPDSTFALSPPVSASRTSPGEDWVEVDVPTLSSNGSLVLNAPALSIYTLFF